MQPYKKLFTFWFSVLIYDRTVEFCQKWIKSWKLKEQMEGAARSGKQNIVEGSDNLTTSLKVCIKLTGIAKSSIEELIGDLEDFLRQRGLPQWEKNELRVVVLRTQSAKLIRSLAVERNLSLLRNLRLPAEPEEACNFLLTLCHQATFLLNRQVESLKAKHEKGRRPHGRTLSKKSGVSAQKSMLRRILSDLSFLRKIDFSLFFCQNESVIDEKNQKPEKSWSAVSLAWELGYTIAIPLVVFALAGRYLDKKLGTTPWLLLAGILLAIVATTWLVWKKTKEIIDH